MKATNKHNIRKAKLTLSVFAIVGLTTACLGSLSTEDKIHKHYTVDIRFFSMDKTQPVDSYKWYGGGSCGPGSGVGLGCYDDARTFKIKVAGKNRKGRFVVNVSIVPGKNDSNTKKDSFEVDFTDLKPKSFELAKNDDGRVYMLNLTPGIKIVDNRPKRADDTSFRFSRWTLLGSMVIFNDSIYAGKIGCRFKYDLKMDNRWIYMELRMGFMRYNYQAVLMKFGFAGRIYPEKLNLKSLQRKIGSAW